MLVSWCLWVVFSMCVDPEGGDFGFVVLLDVVGC